MYFTILYIPVAKIIYLSNIGPCSNTTFLALILLFQKLCSTDYDQSLFYIHRVVLWQSFIKLILQFINRFKYKSQSQLGGISLTHDNIWSNCISSNANKISATRIYVCTKTFFRIWVSVIRDVIHLSFDMVNQGRNCQVLESKLLWMSIKYRILNDWMY